MAATPTRQACPECGKKLKHVGMHMKNVHGIAGGLSGRVHKSRNGAKPEPTFKTRGFTRVEEFIVLEDDDGGMWLAEKIR
jgi:hypothetical protein